MGIFKKVKDILFDEEEVIEEEKPKKEFKVEPKIEKTPEPVIEKKEPVSERELFKSDNTFPFPDFDEDEFDSNVRKPQETNVLEYEKKKKIEKRTDYGRYQKIETKEISEKKKFKPSPIISPVYGILNEDYKPDDVVNKNEGINAELNIDNVRKKAFGTLEELAKNGANIYYETSETVTTEEPSEKQEKVKTIDELLEDTSDVKIDIDEDFASPIEDIQDIKEEKEETKEFDDSDTIENDLFDLIDSMYEKREDGE